MDVLSAYLDDRQAQASKGAEADLRWMRERGGVDPAERLIKWEKWLRKKLIKTLKWPENTAARDKLVGQCIAEITKMVREINGRGWLLDGEALAGHVSALLTPIGEKQRAGGVHRFWPYFQRCVADYTGQHAEEIQFQARRSGRDLGMTTLGAAIKGQSLAELISQNAQRVEKAKITAGDLRRARKQDRSTADTRQQQLL